MWCLPLSIWRPSGTGPSRIAPLHSGELAIEFSSSIRILINEKDLSAHTPSLWIAFSRKNEIIVPSPLLFQIMSQPQSSSSSATQNLPAIIQQLYASLAPNSTCSESEIEFALAVLNSHLNTVNVINADNIQKMIHEKANGKISERDMQVLRESVTKFLGQGGISKKEEKLYVLSQLSLLGTKNQKKKKLTITPLESVHSYQTSSLSSSPSRPSLSARRAVVPFGSSFPTSKSSTSIAQYQQPHPQRNIGLTIFF